jgi:hypothetical protein
MDYYKTMKKVKKVMDSRKMEGDAATYNSLISIAARHNPDDVHVWHEVRNLTRDFFGSFLIPDPGTIFPF